MRTLPGLIALFLAGLFPLGASAQVPTNAALCSGAPTPAALVGYCMQTLNSSSFSTTNVDTAMAYPSATTSPGKWYVYNAMGHTPSTAGIALSNGVMTVGCAGSSAGCQNGAGNWNVASAAVKGTSWVGTMYGGGAYVQFTVATNPANIHIGGVVGQVSGSTLTIATPLSANLAQGKLVAGDYLSDGDYCIPGGTYVASGPATTVAGGVFTLANSAGASLTGLSCPAGDTINVVDGWPAVWADEGEGMFGAYSGVTSANLGGGVWPNSVCYPASTPTGTEGTCDWMVEADFFEIMDPKADGGVDYQNTMHLWYGDKAGWGSSSTWPLSYRSLPSGTTFVTGSTANYITYGWLWVPATATSCGYTQEFVNGVAVAQPVNGSEGAPGQYRWRKYNSTTDLPNWQNTIATPASAPVPNYQDCDMQGSGWVFGSMDLHHLVLLIGDGAFSTLQVSNVQVWQASAAGNLVQ